MRVIRHVICLLIALILSSNAKSQTLSAAPPQRDAQGTALLQRAIAAIASTEPADSSATGNVTITAGSQTTEGTVSILTRGTNETSIEFQMPNASWSVVFAAGQANRIESAITTALPSS